MIELLAEYGYTFYGSCNCDGHKTNKYRNGIYKIKWRIKKAQFKVQSRGLTIIPWYPESQAENILKEIHVAV